MGKMLKYIIIGLGIYLAMPMLVQMDKFGSFCFAIFMAVCLYIIDPATPNPPTQDDHDDPTP